MLPGPSFPAAPSFRHQPSPLTTRRHSSRAVLSFISSSCFRRAHWRPARDGPPPRRRHEPSSAPSQLSKPPPRPLSKPSARLQLARDGRLQRLYCFFRCHAEGLKFSRCTCVRRGSRPVVSSCFFPLNRVMVFITGHRFGLAS